MRRSHEVDWTRRYEGTSVAVVRPATTDEVAAVLRCCARAGVAVVAQGGNTGLVGGGVPRGAVPSIVLSMLRFSTLGPVDAEAMQVTVGAGVTMAGWRDHARAAGLDAPVDFAARDSATVGGAIATNAGGSRVLRFGTMRSQVVGVEAVLATGGVVGSLAGLPKETAGVHWPSLLAGSEGTLAVVTRARLRLVPRFDHTVTAFVAVGSVDDAVALLGILRRDVPSLDAAEVVLPAALELVVEHLGRAAPVTTPADGCCVMIDCADSADPTEQLTSALHRAGERGLVVDTAFATDATQRAGLLEFRDRITEAIATVSTAVGSPPLKLDVAVPVSALAELTATAHAAAADDGSQLIGFGHLAEGNLHLNFLDAGDPATIASAVLGRVAELGGTISAEHGIGVAKTPWLHLIRAAEDRAAQQALRAALDPAGILNPGVLAPELRAT
ncbi:MAG: FAD-binding oxidoreductase [Ilumatobacter sp.]|nr:FAD-binding oxidoreductase [Ilumatobacter sp.]